LKKAFSKTARISFKVFPNSYFGNPEHGRIEISITDNDQSFTTEADSKYESFLELLTTLESLINKDGEFFVTWLEEPIMTTWIFTKLKDEIVFEILRSIENQSVFRFAGSYQEVCSPFLSALKSLQNRFTENELEIGIQDSFPSADLYFYEFIYKNLGCKN